jgi:hypothetical protein
LSDLIQHLPSAALEGLRDHAGDRWLVVDLDPTRMATLLHVEADDPTRPLPRHSRLRVALPGYSGRKRADLVRSRMTAFLTHAGMWMLSIAEPGNGHRTPMLQAACERLRAFSDRIPGAPALLVRADGEFGYVQYAAVIRQAGHHYLLRCADYRRVLSDPEVKNVLSQGSTLRMREPESKVEREVFDVPALRWQSADGKTELSTRMVITRTVLPPDVTKPSVGHLHDGWVYELFVLDLPPSACSAAEAVSLYLGRGLLERALGQEDTELPTDRWICSEGHGQDLFQQLCQWVWNHRVVLGSTTIGGVSVRRMDWTVTVVSQTPEPIMSLPTGVPQSTHTTTETTERNVQNVTETRTETLTNATSAEETPKRYTAEQFIRDEQGVVRCPAGEVMRRVEVRRFRSGVRERFQAPVETCKQCAQRVACRGSDEPFMKGRILNLPRNQDVPLSSDNSAIPIPADLVIETEPTQQPRSNDQRKFHLPRWQYDSLMWTDIEASRARNTLVQALFREHFEWLPAPAVTTTDTQLSIATMTRDQRARRGRTWKQLVERNDCPPSRLKARILITGISAGLATAIGLMAQSTCSAGYLDGTATKSSGMVATA